MMTAAALRRPAVRTVSRVGTADLLRLALRQHRALILTTFAACLVLALYLLSWRLLGGTPNVLEVMHTSTVLNYGIVGYTLVVAVFWGAPLLSREYEQRTHLLVWSQDVAPTRWLLTKVALLGVIVGAFAVGLEAVNELVNKQLVASLSSAGWMANAFLVGFEGNIALQAGYALAAFAIGIAIGGLLRVPVVAMVVSTGAFGLIRWLVATYVRPVYLPTTQANSFQGTFEQNGVPDPQPLPQELIEFGIFLGIAALCLVIAWLGVRRRRRV